MHVVEIAKGILQRLERLDDRVAVADKLCQRLGDVAKILRANARTMRLFDIGEAVDGSEALSQLLALFQQTFGENRSEPLSALGLGHGSAIKLQPARELWDHCREVGGRLERRVGTFGSLCDQTLAQPGLPDSLPSGELGTLLAQPFEVDGCVACRPGCLR